MTISTTNTLEGSVVTNYLGVVAGETIIGANIVRDFFAGITDIVGGRSDSYERILREARETAMAEMSTHAERIGANAIIGVDIDYETIGANGSMLMVSVSGTAVVVSNL